MSTHAKEIEERLARIEARLSDLDLALNELVWLLRERELTEERNQNRALPLYNRKEPQST